MVAWGGTTGGVSGCTGWAIGAVGGMVCMPMGPGIAGGGAGSGPRPKIIQETTTVKAAVAPATIQTR